MPGPERFLKHLDFKSYSNSWLSDQNSDCEFITCFIINSVTSSSKFIASLNKLELSSESEVSKIESTISSVSVMILLACCRSNTSLIRLSNAVFVCASDRFSPRSLAFASLVSSIHEIAFLTIEISECPRPFSRVTFGRHSSSFFTCFLMFILRSLSSMLCLFRSRVPQNLVRGRAVVSVSHSISSIFFKPDSFYFYVNLYFLKLTNNFRYSPCQYI